MHGDDEHDDLNQEERLDEMFDDAVSNLVKQMKFEDVARAYLKFHELNVVSDVAEGNLSGLKNLET